METKIAILRGINVGGRRKIFMADLRLLCGDLGFIDVQTYIQSGNVIFRSNLDNHELSNKLGDSIKAKFRFDVPVLVRSSDELKRAVSKNPFYKSNLDIEKLHLTFLQEKPTDDRVQEINSFNSDPDKFEIIEKSIFIYCEGKYHQTKLGNNFFEKKLGVGATTRNWKTVLKLGELCS